MFIRAVEASCPICSSGLAGVPEPEGLAWDDRQELTQEELETADNQLTPAAPASQLVRCFVVSLWHRASPKRSHRLIS